MRNSKLAALRAAFPYTVPIFAGFWFLAMAYGIQMSTSGFAFWYPMFMSAVIYGGSLEFVARQYAPVHRRRYDRVYDSDPGGVLNTQAKCRGRCPHRPSGKLRIRRRFPKKHCFLWADRVVRPYRGLGCI